MGESGAGDADGARCEAAAQDEMRKRFAGAWRHLGTFIDGKPAPEREGKPKGIIFYAASGHMAVHVVPDRERQKAGNEPTPQEAKAALDGYVGYFGTYSIDERAGTVTHHRQGSVQPGDAPEVVRAFEFQGDRLILRPVGSRNEVVWERIE